jgi:murein DD-endopeptidase MepM/ murein hydrolase activator NlpD
MSIKFQKGSIPLGLLGLLLVPVSAQAVVNPVLGDSSKSVGNDETPQLLVTTQVSKIAMLSSLEEQEESGLPQFPNLSERSEGKKVEFILASNSLTIPLDNTSEQVNLAPNLLAENTSWENTDPIPLTVIPPASNQEEVSKPVLIPIESSEETNYPTEEANNQGLITNSNNPTIVALESTTSLSESIPLPVILPSSNSLLNNQSTLTPSKTVTNISTRVHKVQPKETLNSIAREYGIGVEELIKANKIEDANLVKINQRLIIPSSKRPNGPTLISSESQQTNSFDSRLTVEREKTTNYLTGSEPNPNNFNNFNPSEQVASAIPLSIEYYNPADQPSTGEMVSPDLPQLYPPEQYLPESQGKFNGYIWPAKGVLTSGYGWRWGRMHKGIDIAGPVGTPIFAAADGEVVAAGWNSGGFGNLVKVKHFDGSLTLYAHNSKIFVRRGQIVTQGQQIAAMGSTGRSTGPHLHFEIHPRPGQAQNPMAFLPKR